jgi:hypothetical protein
VKHRSNNNNNSKVTEMNTMNKNATATGLIQIPEASPRVLIIVNLLTTTLALLKRRLHKSFRKQQAQISCCTQRGEASDKVWFARY